MARDVQVRQVLLLDGLSRARPYLYVSGASQHRWCQSSLDFGVHLHSRRTAIALACLDPAGQGSLADPLSTIHLSRLMGMPAAVQYLPTAALTHSSRAGDERLGKEMKKKERKEWHCEARLLWEPPVGAFLLQQQQHGINHIGLRTKGLLKDTCDYSSATILLQNSMPCKCVSR